MAQKKKNDIGYNSGENRSSGAPKSVISNGSQSQAAPGRTSYARNPQEAAFSQSNVTSLSKATQQAQNSAEEFGRQAWEKWTQSANNAVENLDDLMALNKQAVDATFKCITASGEISQAIGEEFSGCCNDIVAENIEALEDSFACRTFNDFIELQNELFRINSSRAAGAALKIMELSAGYAKAAEPVAEAASEISEKAVKIFNEE